MQIGDDVDFQFSIFDVRLRSQLDHANKSSPMAGDFCRQLQLSALPSRSLLLATLIAAVLRGFLLPSIVHISPSQQSSLNIPAIFTVGSRVSYAAPFIPHVPNASTHTVHGSFSGMVVGVEVPFRMHACMPAQSNRTTSRVPTRPEPRLVSFPCACTSSQHALNFRLHVHALLLVLAPLRYLQHLV